MTSNPSRRRRATVAALAAAGIALAGSLAGLGPQSAVASSHREAPLIAADPAVDNTDLYAFVSPERPGYVTFIANWIPFEEPNGGPNFYPFATDAAYNINVDSDGDAKAGRRVPVDVQEHRPAAAATRSSTTTARSRRSTTRTCCSGRPTRSSRRSTASPFKTRVTDAPVAPSRVGAASMPDYQTLRDQATDPAARAAGSSSPARPTTRSSSTCGSSTCCTAAT